eukprot:scaffold2770_cov104-Cylindrotheca_fusiformis.AAC.2
MRSSSRNQQKQVLRIFILLLFQCYFFCIRVVADDTDDVGQSGYYETSKATDGNTFGPAAAAEEEIGGAKKTGYFEATEVTEFDDRTLLDTFGQAAKEFLTTKVIPDTDSDCKWDWRYVRCGKIIGVCRQRSIEAKLTCQLFPVSEEPYCQCDLTFKLGDYHLGRSCRKRLNQDETTCDKMTPPAPTRGPRLVIQRIVQGSKKLADTVIHRTKTSYRKVQNKVCDQLPENMTCPGDGDEITDDMPMLAWQEKLLCRDQIPDCLMKTPRPRPDS